MNRIQSLHLSRGYCKIQLGVGDTAKYNWECIPVNFKANDLHDDSLNTSKFEEQLIKVQSD
jgi:hypothetical protein